MEIIQKIKTVDGKLFDTIQQAKVHEDELSRLNLLESKKTYIKSKLQDKRNPFSEINCTNPSLSGFSTMLGYAYRDDYLLKNMAAITIIVSAPDLIQEILDGLKLIK